MGLALSDGEFSFLHEMVKGLKLFLMTDSLSLSIFVRKTCVHSILSAQSSPRTWTYGSLWVASFHGGHVWLVHGMCLKSFFERAIWGVGCWLSLPFFAFRGLYTPGFFVSSSGSFVLMYSFDSIFHSSWW